MSKTNTDWQSLEDFVGASAEEMVMMSMGIVDSKNDIGVGDKVRHIEDGLAGVVVEILPSGALGVDWEDSGFIDDVARSDLDLVDCSGLEVG